VSEKKSMKERRKELLAEYGMAFVCISFTIFVIEMLVLVSLIDLMGWTAQDLVAKLGLELEIPETSGTWVMAYMITRALKIPQLILTAAITPFVAKTWRRWRGKGSTDASSAGHEVESIPVTEPRVEGSES
jgi:hypothetical protein